MEKEYFGKWKELPINRRFIHLNFDQYSDGVLSIPTSSFLAKKPN